MTNKGGICPCAMPLWKLDDTWRPSSKARTGARRRVTLDRVAEIQGRDVDALATALSHPARHSGAMQRNELSCG